MTSLAPLTTVFMPSPSCTTYTGYTELVDPEVGSILVKGPLATAGCYPSGFEPANDRYYTPGLCPSGYTFGEDRVTIKDFPTKYGYCCPVLETGSFRPRASDSSSYPLPTRFPCVQIISKTTTLLPVTRVSAASTSTFISIITAATIGAYGVRIEYVPNDKFEPPPDPERFNKARLTFGNQVLVRNDDHGPEMKVSVGVGICVVAGLLAFGVLLLLRRKRKPRQRKAAHNVTFLSQAYNPDSMFHTRRKPVLSVQPLDMSTGPSSGDEEFRAVCMSEAANNASTGVNQLQGHRRRLFYGVSAWTWEMLSLFVSALSLASIIIILDVYEDRQLDDWTPKVSINAVISVLSAVFKGSLAMPVTEGISQLKWLAFAQQPQTLSKLDIYDRASRGAWGSAMMLLGQFKSESRAYLASFGAALAIIALATDPFAQAAMSLYSCKQNGTEIASIPRANRFTVFTGFQYDRTRSTGDFNFGMQLATYRGFIEPPANSSASVSVSCTTGNCTFPADGGATFTSLTMCSRAWDITDRIQPIHTADNQTDFSLGLDNLIGGGKFRMGFVAAPDTARMDPAESIWKLTSLLDVYMLSTKRDNSTDCEPPLCSFDRDYNATFKRVAFVFSLLPCVQTFYAEMSHGRYSETVISEEYLHYGSSNTVSWQLAMNRSMINGKWQQCTDTVTPNEINTVRVYSIPDSGDGVPHTYYPPECVFEFREGNYLSAYIKSTIVSRDALPMDSPWERQLWRNGSTDIDAVTSFANGLALALGAQIRTDKTGTDPDMLREVRGTTLVEKVCIRVHWEYTVFFAAVFVLEVLFLGTVIVSGSRSRLHTDWKSSALAVAFLSAGQSSKGGWPAEDPESEESLLKAARSMQASLMLDDLGQWRLHAQESSWGLKRGYRYNS
ncbi:hypothetical protein LLEC1_06069 [Akanthomyces lecanii]|uniref:Uncharacterized protein n=1 Tax=Cordyceps confragosa TaxID=2714763 RepID=A0A179IL89_CORDF|nr:hypothetical protein LLEC1_06069 [Akanthomyces lecanii]